MAAAVAVGEPAADGGAQRRPDERDAGDHLLQAGREGEILLQVKQRAGNCAGIVTK